MEESNEILRAIRRLWPIIVVATLLGVTAAFFATPAQVSPLLRSYRATNTMLSNGQSSVGTITFNQLPLFATTGEVPKRVAKIVKWSGAPAVLAGEIQAGIDPNTGTFTITSTQVDPKRAVLLADTFSGELIAFLAEQQDKVTGGRIASALKRLEELKAQGEDLDGQLRLDPENELLRAQRDAVVRQYGAQFETYQSLAAEATAGIGLTTLEKAQPVPIETGGFKAPRSRSARVPLAGAVGAVLGLGLVLLMERFDGRVRDRRRAEQVLNAPVVAELATLDRAHRGENLTVLPDQQGGLAEGYRTLRTSLTLFNIGDEEEKPAGEAHVVVVSSPAPGDGKTTTAANVAAAFAETVDRVIVVNADFRRPKISRFFIGDRSASPGVALTALAAANPADLCVKTNTPRLELIDLSSYDAPPGELARVSARAVAALRHEADVIIIDTPPLGVTAEAMEFVPFATVVLLIGRVGRTKIRSSLRASDLMRFAGAPRVCVAMTDTGRLTRTNDVYYSYREPTGLLAKLRRPKRVAVPVSRSASAPKHQAPATARVPDPPVPKRGLHSNGTVDRGKAAVGANGSYGASGLKPVTVPATEPDDWDIDDLDD